MSLIKLAINLIKLADDWHWKGDSNPEKYFSKEDNENYLNAQKRVETAKTEKIPFLKSRKKHIQHYQDLADEVYNNAYYNAAKNKAKINVNGKWITYK